MVTTKSYRYVPPRPALWLPVGFTALIGVIIGLLTAQGALPLLLPYAIAGGLIFGGIATALRAYTNSRLVAGLAMTVALFGLGISVFSLGYALVVGIVGFFVGRMVVYISTGDYRLPVPSYADWGEVLWFYSFRVICACIFLFLIIPIVILVPLSFNQEPYFSFTPGMIRLDPDAYSLRWYWDILQNGMAAPEAIQGWWEDMWNNSQWVRSIQNSFKIGIFATLLSTALGTLAAIGLSRAEMPWRRPIMALLISPMIVPLVITASGLFFFFSDLRLAKSTDYDVLGIVLAHAVLGIPFVIITVTATLVGFDKSLVRASASMGAGPIRTFFKIQMPLILPGVISGALFAFITSFDEVVVVLQMATAEQRTIPRQMFSGIREQISPTILAVATVLVILSIFLLAAVEILRRRSERLRGMSPG